MDRAEGRTEDAEKVLNVKTGAEGGTENRASNWDRITKLEKAIQLKD